MTVSPGSSRTLACWPVAMRIRAERGSPWLPVTRYSTRSRGSEAASISSLSGGRSRR